MAGGDDLTEVAALATAFQTLTDRVARTNDEAAALSQVVTLATATLPGCDWAGIAQVTRRQPHTMAATDQVVLDVDQI